MVQSCHVHSATVPSARSALTASQRVCCHVADSSPCTLLLHVLDILSFTQAHVLPRVPLPTLAHVPPTILPKGLQLLYSAQKSRQVLLLRSDPLPPEPRLGRILRAACAGAEPELRLVAPRYHNTKFRHSGSCSLFIVCIVRHKESLS